MTLPKTSAVLVFLLCSCSASVLPGGTGQPGTTGNTGDKGATGDKGPAGDKGPTGDKGPPGDGSSSGGSGGGSVLLLTQAGCTPEAKADDGVDDSPAFACALEKLKGKGGILQIPAGTFDVKTASIAVPEKVIVQGVGYATILAQTHTLLGPAVRLSHSTQLRDLMLTQEQPPTNNPGWQPYMDYDFQIRVEADQVTVSNIKMQNPTKGIGVYPVNPNGSVGQIHLFEIRGQPLLVGIQIDHALDVVHVQQLHFWPFWSADKNVMKFTISSGVGLKSLRNDNPVMGQMFFFGYRAGLQFDRSTSGANAGITSKPKVSQMECDICPVGIEVIGSGVQGATFSQITHQGVRNEYDMGTAGIGVNVKANDVSISISQLDCAVLGANGIRVEGINNVISVSGSFIREWNTTEKGYPAFELVAGSAGSRMVVMGGATGQGHNAVVAGGGVVLRDTMTEAPLR